MSATIHRRGLPLVIVFVFGVVMLFEYFSADPASLWLAGNFRKWAVDLVAFTLVFGFFVSNRTHLGHIKKRTPGQWPFSALLLAILWFTTIVGITLGVRNDLYQWTVQNIMVATYGAIMGSCGFFVITASYRAFLARTIDSALLLLAGFVALMGGTTIGEFLWPGFVPSNLWLMTVIVPAAERGILIAAAVGTAGILLRTLIGVETGWLGAKE